MLQLKEQVVQTQAAQLAQLQAAKDALQAQVVQLETALQGVDTRKQTELLRTQLEQVRRARCCCCSWVEAAGSGVVRASANGMPLRRGTGP